jgi:hypothetical protein
MIALFCNANQFELRCHEDRVHHGGGNGALASVPSFQSLTADRCGLKVGGEALMVVTHLDGDRKPARYLILV